MSVVSSEFDQITTLVLPCYLRNVSCAECLGQCINLTFLNPVSLVTTTIDVVPCACQVIQLWKQAQWQQSPLVNAFDKLNYWRHNNCWLHSIVRSNLPGTQIKLNQPTENSDAVFLPNNFVIWKLSDGLHLYLLLMQPVKNFVKMTFNFERLAQPMIVISPNGQHFCFSVWWFSRKHIPSNLLSYDIVDRISYPVMSCHVMSCHISYHIISYIISYVDMYIIWYKCS